MQLHENPNSQIGFRLAVVKNLFFKFVIANFKCLNVYYNYIHLHISTDSVVL